MTPVLAGGKTGSKGGGGYLGIGEISKPVDMPFHDGIKHGFSCWRQTWKLPDTTPDHICCQHEAALSTGFEIPPIPRYQHPITSTGLPHPYIQFLPLAAPANTGVSLPFQLMTATVLAEKYYILSIFIVICQLQ